MSAEDLLSSIGAAPAPTLKKLKASPERRRQWLKALRLFKRGLQVRLKMGVIEHYCKQVEEERRDKSKIWEKPEWDSVYWRDKLYAAIHDSEFSPEILLGIARSIGRTYYTQRAPRVVDFMPTADKILKAQSIHLRIRFGVFERG